MVPISIHIVTDNEAFDPDICIDGWTHGVPREGEQLIVSPSQYRKLEKLIKKHGEEATVNLDDSYVVQYVRHNLGSNLVHVALGPEKV